jgi:hypothetical protein
VKTGDKIFTLVLTFIGAIVLGIIALIFSEMVIMAIMVPLNASPDQAVPVGLVVGIIVFGLFFLKIRNMLS